MKVLQTVFTEPKHFFTINGSYDPYCLCLFLSRNHRSDCFSVHSNCCTSFGWDLLPQEPVSPEPKQICYYSTDTFLLMTFCENVKMSLLPLHSRHRSYGQLLDNNELNTLDNFPNPAYDHRTADSLSDC